MVQELNKVGMSSGGRRGIMKSGLHDSGKLLKNFRWRSNMIRLSFKTITLAERVEDRLEGG